MVIVMALMAGFVYVFVCVYYLLFAWRLTCVRGCLLEKTET